MKKEARQNDYFPHLTLTSKIRFSFIWNVRQTAIVSSIFLINIVFPMYYSNPLETTTQRTQPEYFEFCSDFLS
jgi:hypothetical protein